MRNEWCQVFRDTYIRDSYEIACAKFDEFIPWELSMSTPLSYVNIDKVEYLTK